MRTMQKQDCFLAVDCGTTSSKGALVSLEGRVLGSVSKTRSTYFPQPGYAEQSLDELWNSVCEVTSKLASHKNMHILGLSFSGTIGDAITIDTRLKPVFKRFILYSDQRSISQCRALAKRIGPRTVYKISGNPVSPASCLPKWLWIKDRQSHAFRRTWKFIQPTDFVVLKSCGQVCTDYVSASATMAFDIRKRIWSQKILSDVGMDVDKLPEAIESTTIAGELTSAAAKQLGLPTGLPVVIGAGDTGAMMLGAGAVEDGDTVFYLGGGAEVDFVTDKLIFDHKMRLPIRCHVVRGEYFTSVTALASGVAINWLLGLFCHSGQDRQDLVGSFTKLARASGVGANGLFFLPYLLGEQGAVWDTKAKGVFVGLTASTTNQDLYRAVLESTAYSLCQILSIYRRMGLRPRNFSVCGGGGRNQLLREIVTDALGVKTRRHAYPGEVATVGAAICAAVGLRRYNSLGAAAKAMVRYHGRVMPNFDNHVKYARILSLSERAYRTLRKIMHELSDLERAKS